MGASYQISIDLDKRTLRFYKIFLIGQLQTRTAYGGHIISHTFLDFLNFSQSETIVHGDHVF
jgi:hypothetical protein